MQNNKSMGLLRTKLHEAGLLAPSEPMNLDRLLSRFSRRFPEGTISIGWVDGRCFAYITHAKSSDHIPGQVETIQGLRIDAWYSTPREAVGWLILKAVEVQE